MLFNSVLIIDDEDQLRSLLRRIISLEGFQVKEAKTLKSGIAVLEKDAIDIILCDVKLPDGNGIAFTQEVKKRFPFIEVILLTAFGNIADGVQSMRNGAFDYITKGNDNEKIIPLLNRAMEKIQLQKRVAQLEERVGKQYSFDNILGQSTVIKNAITLAKKVAPTDATVLLLGETGSGKEVFAQAIHNGSKRANKPFIALNCSAFSKELLESEIFGHKAGAFTSAIKDKKGLMEEANTGTLFLDEIGEMHVDLQSKLLRVLETSEFIKVGDIKPTSVNVRIIAATNRDLQKEAQEGKFREDLFYRLNVFTITLPALRDRKEDISLLATSFIKQFAQKSNKRVDGMSTAFAEYLDQHDWKGNIRELKNVIERAMILAEDSLLNVNDLPVELRTISYSNRAGSFDLSTAEKIHITHVLHYTKGNKSEAARLLNIGLTTLYRKIEEYRITYE
jgi:DNA-binding NtrC family response regulator